MAEAEDAHGWYRALRARVLGGVRNARPGQILLDAGCGTGGMLARVAAEATGLRAFGVDLSPLAIESCRARGFRGLARASTERLPLRDACIDWILSLDVLYHADVVDDAAALRELARVARPGGRLVLNLPAFRWLAGEHDRAVRGARRYAPGEVRALLARSGWRPLRVTCWNLVGLPVLWAVRRFGGGREGAPTDDLRRGGRWAWALLSPALAAERFLTRFVPLPFGTSVFAVAEKA